MERISLDGTAADELEAGSRRHALSEPLGTTHLAVNRYRVPPGSGLPGGLHAHADQAETFVVLAGRATFETLDGEVTVTSGEAVRFEPGEFQSGRNAGELPLAVLALGAPRASDDVRLPVPCPTCGFDQLRLDPANVGLRFACPECDARHVPAPCPGCDSEDLQVTLDAATTPVVACQDCATTDDEPPVRD